MSAMKPIPENSPLMKAWEKYSAGHEYENSFRWAKFKEHRKGSLSAAFIAGYLAANPDGDKETDTQSALSTQVGGRQDIEKAIHFLNLLLEIEYPEGN